MQEFIFMRENDGAPITIGRVFTDQHANGKLNGTAMPTPDIAHLGQVIQEFQEKIKEYDTVIKQLRSLQILQRFEEFDRRMAEIEREIEDWQIMNREIAERS